MAHDWPRVRLGDFITVRGGLSYKGNLVGTGNAVLVGMGSVSHSERFLMSGTRTYGGEFSETHRLNPGDLVIATRQQSDNLPILGFPARIPADLIGRDIVIATNLYKVVNNSEIDNRFLYWLLRGHDYRERILNCSKGTTVRMLTKDAVEDFNFACPPLDEREQIVCILDTLDDKIELNRRMAATLEEMARALFQSWFVDFDPVRAKAEGRSTGLPPEIDSLFPDSFQESELGEIPAGWTTSTLNEEVADVVGGDWGQEDHSGEYTEPALCIRGADIPNLQAGRFGKMPTRYLKPSSLARRRLIHGDIVFEISGGSPTQATGRVVLIEEALLKRCDIPLVCSNFCRLVRPRSLVMSRFVYLWLRLLYAQDEMYQYETGTTGIKNFGFTFFSESREFALPDHSSLEQFDRRCKTLLERVSGCAAESEVLAALRDALLPKLISGEIRTKGL
jgi:type I restriction enzyme S subunit